MSRRALALALVVVLVPQTAGLLVALTTAAASGSLGPPPASQSFTKVCRNMCECTACGSYLAYFAHRWLIW